MYLWNKKKIASKDERDEIIKLIWAIISQLILLIFLCLRMDCFFRVKYTIFITSIRIRKYTVLCLKIFFWHTQCACKLAKNLVELCFWEYSYIPNSIYTYFLNRTVTVKTFEVAVIFLFPAPDGYISPNFKILTILGTLFLKLFIKLLPSLTIVELWC